MLGIVVGLIAGAAGGNLTDLIGERRFSLGRKLNTGLGATAGLFAGVLYSAAGAAGFAGIAQIAIQGICGGLAFVVVVKFIKDKKSSGDSE